MAQGSHSNCCVIVMATLNEVSVTKQSSTISLSNISDGNDAVVVVYFISPGKKYTYSVYTCPFVNNAVYGFKKNST